MAKSVRSSVSKRNSAKLRATVFGPADNARTERLSAKLQELASQPKSTDHEMKVNDTDEQSKPAETEKPEINEAMDIDRGTGSSTKSRSKKSGRIQKRHTKNSVVFAKNAYGVKQPSKKRK